MSFVFVHTADWQIGKAFAALPKDVAAALAEARVAAIDALAEAALGAGAGHVLVAGDVFDSETPSPRTILQLVARLAQHGHVMWHLLPGNHDPHRPAGLWERILRDDPPLNIRVHLKPQPIEIERGVWLLPAPLTGRAAATDPTAHFQAAATPAGALRVGLAHGSVRGFGSDTTAAIGIAPDRAKLSGLDYFALGDWHGTKRIDARTWYSGTPEPDRFRDNEAGHALVVRLTPGAPPGVGKVRTGRFAWLRHELAFRDIGDFAPLDDKIANAAARPSDVLLQLALSGRANLAQRQQIARRRDLLMASLRHLDMDVAKLAVKVEDADLDTLGPAGEVRQVGENLARLAGDTAASTAPIASEALSMLFDLAAEAEGAAP